MEKTVDGQSGGGVESWNSTADQVRERVDDTEFVEPLGRTTKYEIGLLLLEESAELHPESVENCNDLMERGLYSSKPADEDF
jgi:hypothetical protein